MQYYISESESTKETAPTSSLSESVQDDDEREIPSVVIYLVEPFTLGSDQPELQRLSLLALLRCYQSILSAVPDNIRNNISVQVSCWFIGIPLSKAIKKCVHYFHVSWHSIMLQVISLESIVELNKSRNRMRHSDHMRALAFNIFSQCRRLLVHTNNVKSLTGFGTAAMADHFLKSKDVCI